MYFYALNGEIFAYNYNVSELLQYNNHYTSESVGWSIMHVTFQQEHG